MDETELNEVLIKHDLNLRSACVLIHLKTGALINPNHIRTNFDRGRYLSEPMTAMLRLLFQGLDNDKKD